jgi:hypothetical protein
MQILQCAAPDSQGPSDSWPNATPIASLARRISSQLVRTIVGGAEVREARWAELEL